MKRLISENKSNWKPCDEQIALWPDEVSGNDINGVGETELRPPSKLYWHDPEATPHGKLQPWMMDRSKDRPELHDIRKVRLEVMAKKPIPIAPKRIERSPEENKVLVLEKGLSFGPFQIGMVRPRPEWIYEGYEFDYPWVIILGIPEDYERIQHAPEIISSVAVVEAYTNGWRFGQPLADWIRSQGWRAEVSCGPPAGPVTLIPAALACGFGELGKHGSIISREMGSSFRLSAVFTDMPLIEDGADDIGSDDFCSRCQLCVNACPVDALSHDKKWVRGVEKWYVDFDRCAPYFNENWGCGICIAVCPWSPPGRAAKLAEKMEKRRERQEAVFAHEG